jgi:hypothetical protein
MFGWIAMESRRQRQTSEVQRGLLYNRGMRAHALLGSVVLAACGLAACYDPRPLPGAPCSEVEPCPSGQQCIAGACARGGAIVDASGGGDGSMTITDRDSDGVADTTDNCADIANGDQVNEDGDRFGDACDPCPIEANNTPGDPDGDGVADGCDPHPAAAGDRIVAFEGFAHPLPAGWQVIGTAMQTGSELVLTAAAGNHTALVPPVLSIANGTITASMIVDATVGTLAAGATLVMPYDPAQHQGIACELYAPNATLSTGHYISIYDSPADMERAKRVFAWTIATPYRMTMTRSGGNGSNYACSVTPNGAAAQTATGQTTATPAASKPGIMVYSTNARAAWMLVVASP